jgi:flagellar basal body-associated protein FliL
MLTIEEIQKPSQQNGKMIIIIIIIIIVLFFCVLQSFCSWFCNLLRAVESLRW